MIKTLQFVKYLKNTGYSVNQIIDELTELVDNGCNDKFDLTANEINSISKIFNDNDKFEAVLVSVGF